jgi:hypothetical protein
MHHWNRVKTSQGECRLKIPVNHVFGDSITAVRTRDELGWKDKHLKTLRMNYSKSAHVDFLFPQFADLLNANYDSLADMNVAIITWIASGFGFGAELYRTSQMNINTVRENRIIDICLALKGDKYISGNGARSYQSEQHFNERGIELVYTDYHPVKYTQQWMKIGFLDNMSVLDYVFNCGFDWEYVEKAVKEIRA